MSPQVTVLDTVPSKEGGITPFCLFFSKNKVSTLTSDTAPFLKIFLHHVAHKWGKTVQMSHKSRWNSPEVRRNSEVKKVGF